MKKIKMKKELRGIILQIIMSLIGIFIILLGGAVFLISIPLVLIIIGIFIMIGAAVMISIGGSMILGAKYKNEKVVCNKCKNVSTQNYGLLKFKHESFKCKSCKEMVLVE